MIGKTGVGKTYLAKKIAEEVFGDEKYLIRFDMSEYADKTSINKLIGSSAGYVGYEEGGLLTEAIKKNKYAVLLVDEIEKANTEVFNLFLQILDEGFLTDNTGRKVDFKNTIIILTSNVGTKQASVDKGIGFTVNSDEKYRSVLEKELKDKFPPEFLNRLDEIVYFNSLTDENLKKIIEIELNKTIERFEKNGYNIVYDDNVVDYLLNIVLKDKDYGARPILRTIQKEIENKIVDIVLNDENITNFNIKQEEKSLIFC
jgi:ATP-dependent Clp protease ATP-binding subunit ClpC